MGRILMSVLVTLSICIFSTLVFAQNKKVLLISDIDDTIKVSHVLSAWGKVSRAADVTTPFRGMAALYQLIINENPGSTKIVYLSNAPEEIAGIPALKISHQTFLSLNRFPPGELNLREDLFEENHKIKEIRKILQTESPDVVIFVGDNGEKDVDVYHQATLEFANKGMQMISFIHQMYSSKVPFYKPDFLAEQGRELYSEQNGFVTPIEISLKLNENKLLSEAAIDWLMSHVAPAIIAEKNMKWDGLTPLTFPAFKNCSDFKWPYASDSRFEKLENKIKKSCN